MKDYSYTTARLPELSKNQKILDRLDQLYHDLPLEYCGYVLTAINDIEKIIYSNNPIEIAADHMSDKGYQVGDLKDIPERGGCVDIVDKA